MNYFSGTGTTNSAAPGLPGAGSGFLGSLTSGFYGSLGFTTGAGGGTGVVGFSLTYYNTFSEPTGLGSYL